jgi:uncharacterized heparinase superfamily protein
LASPAGSADGATRLLLGKAIAAQRVVLHPDGEIALFNDSAFGIAPRCDLLRRLAQRLGVPGDHATPTDLVNAGYFTLAAGGQRVVFDAGALGPDHLPAHAHCDALSFEWSVGTVRVVTDTGVDRYEAGPEREFQRSVRAHATLEVDGRDQGEPFGSFRMGRRPVVSGERVDDHTVRGSHDGFGSAGLHRRMIALRPGSGPSWTDRLDGPAEQAVTVRIGLSPETHASVVEGRASIEAGSAGRWRWSTPPGGAVSIEVGTYCPQFGKNVPRNVLTWRGVAGRSRDLGFGLIPAD